MVGGVAARSVAGGVLALHKSCDPCRAGKRKCNGFKPCSRCIQLDEREFCFYSLLKPRRPYKTKKRRAPGVSSCAGAKEDSDSVAFDGGCRRVTFNRCGLAPSPATGLVGLEENTFLSDYFRCVGFMPFTSQSRIREAISRIMTSPVWGRSKPQCAGDRQHSDTVTTLVDSTSREKTGDPSMCVFWCACAIGALVQGRSVKSASGGVFVLSSCMIIVKYRNTLYEPVTGSSPNSPACVQKRQVSRYARMATDALKNFCGPDTIESVEAFTILAYLSGFRGDADLFQGYLERADRFLRQVIDLGPVSDISVGFNEIVKHGETIKILSGRMNDDELKSFCKNSTLPEIYEFATEGEMFRFAMLSYRAFVKAFYSHVSTTSSCEPLSKGREGIPTRGIATHTRVEQPDGQHQHVEMNISARDGFSCGIRKAMLRVMKHCEGGMGRLDQVLDRPSIRDGIGAILLNGLLVFEKAAHGDYDSLVERLGRFSEVYERYPGLCRLLMWTHVTHIVLAIIIATEHPRSRQLYDKLRSAHNPVCLANNPQIPPFEEWRGLSQICDHLYCRTMEEIIMKQKLAFRPHSSHARSLESAEKQQRQQHTLHASVAIGIDVSTAETPQNSPTLLEGKSEALSTFEAKCVTFSEDPAATAAAPGITGIKGNLAQGQFISPLVSECPNARSWALKGQAHPSSSILSQDATGYEGSGVMPQVCEFFAVDDPSDQHTNGQNVVSNTPDANAVVTAAVIATGAMVEKEKGATAFSSDPPEIQMSESELDFDALAAADWLDVTYTMLEEHKGSRLLQ